MTPRQIRAIRGWFNLSQTELAEMLGVSQNTVARWETGTRTPSRMATTALKRLWDQMVGESTAA